MTNLFKTFLRRNTRKSLFDAYAGFYFNRHTGLFEKFFGQPEIKAVVFGVIDLLRQDQLRDARLDHGHGARCAAEPLAQVEGGAVYWYTALRRSADGPDLGVDRRAKRDVFRCDESVEQAFIVGSRLCWRAIPAQDMPRSRRFDYDAELNGVARALSFRFLEERADVFPAAIFLGNGSSSDANRYHEWHKVQENNSGYLKGLQAIINVFL